MQSNIFVDDATRFMRTRTESANLPICLSLTAASGRVYHETKDASHLGLWEHGSESEG